MATKTPKRPSAAQITAKAKIVLAFATEKARECRFSNELFNAIFSPTGKATELFPTESDRSAFTRTRESKSVFKLIHTLPNPPVTEFVDFSTNDNRTLSLRLPKSVHESLLAEAAAERVSLDQLCLSKLVVKLRDVV